MFIEFDCSKFSEPMSIVRFSLLIWGRSGGSLPVSATQYSCSISPGVLRCQLLRHGCIALCPTFYPLMCKKLALTLASVLCSLYHDSSQKILPTSGRTAFETNGTSTAPIFFTGIKVAVDTTHEQYFTPQANHSGSDISGRPHGMPHELTMDLVGDHDIEDGAERRVM